MKFFKFLFVLFLLAALGGFIYFALTDVEVQQELVNEDIPVESLPNHE